MRRTPWVGVAALGLALLAVPARATEPCGGDLEVSLAKSYGVGAVTGEPDGGFVVLWTGVAHAGTDTNGSSVQGRRFDPAGVPRGEPFQVNDQTLGSQGSPAVAADGAGHYLVVWESGGVAGRLFDADWLPVGDEFQVNDVTLGEQNQPSVARVAGGFVAVWHRFVDEDLGDYSRSIQARRLAPDGQPLGPQFEVNETTSSVQNQPAVAADGSGGFVVVWAGYGSAGGDTEGSSIQARRFDAQGAPVTGQFQVNSYTTGYQYAPAVVGDGAGGFLVAWQSTKSSGDDPIWSIETRRYDATGLPAGPQLQTNAFTNSVQEAASLARDAAGEFLAAWQSWGSAGTDHDRYSIQLRRLDPAGAPLAPEEQVNVVTLGHQTFPVVGPSGDGFVVAWHTYEPFDIETGAIRARRFTATCPTTTTSSTTTTTLPPTELLSGDGLVLAERRAGPVRVEVTSRDRALGPGRGAGTADDPTLAGATLRLHATGWGLDHREELPASGWRWKRRAWRFRGADGTRVTAKAGRLLHVLLPERPLALGTTDPTPVGVVLDLAGRRLCLEFGSGTAVRKRRKLVARDAPAPPACTP